MRDCDPMWVIGEGVSVETAVKEKVQVAGGRSYLFFKRLFDIVVSVCAATVLLIPMVVIAIMIKLDSPGPMIFKQERLGKDGKPFTIYKFRSMVEDAEAAGPRWAALDDQRCTKLGAKLRKSRLDELPQLWNILKGDMSFVGPRPERAYFYNEFEKYIPNFRDRLVVRPGLTGHAQVNGGYSLRPEEKIVYDMEYIHNRSVRMDLQCLWQTVRVIFFREGAR